MVQRDERTIRAVIELEGEKFDYAKIDVDKEDFEDILSSDKKIFLYVDTSEVNILWWNNRLKTLLRAITDFSYYPFVSMKIRIPPSMIVPHWMFFRYFKGKETSVLIYNLSQAIHTSNNNNNNNNLVIEHLIMLIN